MKILIVAFYDDNFGDMLIRTCFTQLLRVVLQNLQVTAELSFLPLKSLENEVIAQADLILFPGGGLFGLSYLDFADYVETVLEIAEQNQIPVVFSSLGMNNMDAQEADDDRLARTLHRSCIRAVSVREQEESFRRYAGEIPYPISTVCDPAVWAGYVYAGDLPPRPESAAPVVGINVVRGGLFRDNGIDWVLQDEMDYLAALAEELERRGLETRFFTNGQTLDSNALRFFANESSVPPEKLILPDTAREVVQAIARFDAVAAIRMHSSILSYALGVPSVNLVWNAKVSEFYQQIGYPERAIPAGAWSPERVADALCQALQERPCQAEPAVLMTLYRFLFETLGGLLEKAAAPEMFDFETVCRTLARQRVPLEEDVTDLRLKVRKGENRYVSIFSTNRRRARTIETLKQKNKGLAQDKKALEKTVQQEKAARKSAEQQRQKSEKALERTRLDLQMTQKKLEKSRQDLQKARQKNEKQKRELEHLNRTLAVRIHKRLGRIKRFLLRLFRGKNKG